MNFDEVYGIYVLWTKKNTLPIKSPKELRKNAIHIQDIENRISLLKGTIIYGDFSVDCGQLHSFVFGEETTWSRLKNGDTNSVLIENYVIYIEN